MYKTISNEIIRQFNPCYDPSKFITDENEELPIKDWVQKYRKIVPAKDIIWLLLRNEFLSEKDLRLFAVWCARESLKLIANPDERSVEACNVAERYTNRQATKDELDAAYNAAYAAYDDACATYNAAHVVVYDVAAAYDAHAAASYIAANSAVTAARAASAYAAHAAYTHAAAFAAQVDQLLTYFE
jgi:hypothetical protein